MSPDAWPSSDESPAPLPRIEDLPLADPGYDQEAVRLAFDSFYRHAAQLDASLRALEAVEVFRRDADALRNDLRALRALGLGGGETEPAWATRTYESARPSIPGRRVPPRRRVGADRRSRGDRRRREVQLHRDHPADGRRVRHRRAVGVARVARALRAAGSSRSCPRTSASLRRTSRCPHLVGISRRSSRARTPKRTRSR